MAQCRCQEIISNMHVLIAGAGLGGLTLAQSLRKQGISYEIFERDANRDARFQGWAIALHTYGPETQNYLASPWLTCSNKPAS